MFFRSSGAQQHWASAAPGLDSLHGEELAASWSARAGRRGWGEGGRKVAASRVELSICIAVLAGKRTLYLNCGHDEPMRKWL